jgi:hypothetical protein
MYICKTEGETLRVHADEWTDRNTERQGHSEADEARLRDTETKLETDSERLRQQRIDTYAAADMETDSGGYT